MAQAPIWPVATDAFIADTTGLSAEETGAYIMLLMCLWRNNGDPLPLDHKRLSRMARVSSSRWKQVWPSIKEFFIIKDNLITQKRLQVDLEKVKAKITSNRIAGSLGGIAKSLKYKGTGLADASNPPQRKDSENVPIHKPYSKPNTTPPLAPPKGGNSSKRGTKWNEDSVPELWLAEMKNKYPDWPEGVLAYTEEEFCLFWKAATGQRATKRDWHATFQGWCLRKNKEVAKKDPENTKAVEDILKGVSAGV